MAKHKKARRSSWKRLWEALRGVKEAPEVSLGDLIPDRRSKAPEGA